jgi:CheY-like chemotaxis protein
VSSDPLSNRNIKKRILIVDDEKDVAMALQVGLGGGGFDVDAFTDPFLALKSFKPGLYNLVLIDIVMPKIDGFGFYERLKKVDPDMKACFLTASEMYHEEFRKAESSPFNNDLFLQKPISIDDLIKEVNKRINSA